MIEYGPDMKYFGLLYWLELILTQGILPKAPTPVGEDVPWEFLQACRGPQPDCTCPKRSFCFRWGIFASSRQTQNTYLVNVLAMPCFWMFLSNCSVRIDFFYVMAATSRVSTMPKLQGHICTWLFGIWDGILQIAKEHGILLDPIYSLAAWETACKIAADTPADTDVLMLHSGGSLGLHGLAQRFPDQFWRTFDDS